MHILNPCLCHVYYTPLVKGSHMAKPKIKRQGNILCSQ